MVELLSFQRRPLYVFILAALFGITDSLHIPVLYESKHLLIVNKPHGVAHHEDPNEQSPGILQLIRQQRNYSHPSERLWGVHRLDKVTSGILVLAKDQTTASTLSRFFAEGQVKKIYFGVSSKKPKKKKQGWVSGEMVRSRRETWMLTRASAKDSSNFAKTRFFTAGLNANGTSVNSPKTVIMFLPFTGKTHQLRVAAKSMGIALLGDPIYSDGTAAAGRGRGDSHSTSTARTMLHASGISIPSLCDNEDSVNVWCPPPFFDEESSIEAHAAFQQAVARLMTKHCDELGIVDAMLKQQSR